MTNKEAIKFLQQLYPNGGHCWLDEQRIEAIGMAVKALQEEPASEDLGEYINKLSKQFPEVSFAKLSRIAVRVAKWQKTNLLKPADGDDLPEYDREVIVLIKYNAQRNIHDEEYPTYRVGFGHRPDPKGWEGKSVTTGKVEHYTPKTYDKGGWNIPNVVYWLDVKLPKEIEL